MNAKIKNIHSYYFQICLADKEIPARKYVSKTTDRLQRIGIGNDDLLLSKLIWAQISQYSFT